MEVLVTGGDTELGRAIAEGFRDAGHRVVMTGARRDELEVAAKELDVDALVVDNTDPVALAQVRAEFPHHLDTIVNVPAPRWTDGDPRAFTPAQHAAAWHNALDASVLAPVLTLQTVGDHLRSGGSIVSVVPELRARRQRRRGDQGGAVGLDRRSGPPLRHPRNHRQRGRRRPWRRARL